MYTYQDFLEESSSRGVDQAISTAIHKHMATELYSNAVEADRYDKQKNSTIMSFVKWLYSDNGNRTIDTTSSNHRICSNFFNRLNTQRMAYSLGNGVTFTGEGTKEKLGLSADSRIRSIGYNALIHGVCFAFWNLNHIEYIPVTEFAPLWDEDTSVLRAGIRFWQIDRDKPCIAVLYEEDGYSRYKGNNGMANFYLAEEKHPYKITTSRAPVDHEGIIVHTENYGGALPVVPFWGSRLHQSTLVGLRSAIDAYDLVKSGFANDMIDCSEIYWIVGGAGGATDADLARFRDRLKLQHIAAVTDTGETPITPYTQNVPHEARDAFLAELRSGMYEDFGALDVHTISAGATNDHIDAAYQPLDENADEFEYQMIDGIQSLLAFLGIEDTPIFKRNRISNQKEATEMILLAAQYLDDETILSKLPFVTPDEVKEIIGRKDEEDANRLLSDSTDDEDIGGDDE